MSPFPSSEPEGEFDPTRVVIRDKRRIDPESGEVRPSMGTPTGAGPGGDPVPSAATPAVPAASSDLAVVRSELDERTADLQRLQAEYANYRKRVDRDRLAVAEQTTGALLMALLPVLDDIGRARAHGELEGGFRSVAEALEATAGRLGLETYGEPGEPFDPAVHEALMHTYSGEVSEPTAVEVLQPGYRLGNRVLRPARVTVAEPELVGTDPVSVVEGPAD
ncbi:MAG: nucleotide exchange factor GrpE [Actinomycetota bacterium]|nr:nucleotide exchange factor GrpE [Actinomycetota bacterium]